MKKKGEKYEKFNRDGEDLIVKKRLSGEVVSINQITRPGISDKGRRIINKTFKRGTKPVNWSAEYREHIIYQLIYHLVSPHRPKIAAVAKEMGLDIATIQSVIRTKQFIEIKNSLRKELRSKWGADIDAVVIKKALMGSKYHAELFYKLEGELVDKVSVKHEEEIPADPEQRKNKIKQYLHELGLDVGLADKETVDSFVKTLK